MMDGAMIAATAFVVNTAVLLIGGGVAFGRLDSRMKDMVAQAQKETDEKIDSTIGHFSETATAIRQKITEVELFMRDNYIKRDSFYHGVDNLASSVKTLSDNLDGRLIRMENKIDAGRQERRDSSGT